MQLLNILHYICHYMSLYVTIKKICRSITIFQIPRFLLYVAFLLKMAYHYSSVTQTGKTEFLVINQSELEGNKFGLIAYCFILKAKQIIDEPNI